MDHLVNIYRGGLLESFHTGSIAVVDSTGKLLAYAGDPTESTFVRSAVKPFQAIAVLQEGAATEFDLSPEEIALVCSSHGGEAHHVATAAAILRKGDLDESDLLCGAHIPLDERAAVDLRMSGEPATPLHNNCSGKHAGMLLASRLLDASPWSYIEAEHPLQLLNQRTLAEFAGLAPDEIPAAIDGCGVPTYRMSLYRTAFAWARFMATASEGTEPWSLPRFADSARDILDAMTTCPEYVAGAWSITTPLIASFDRQLLGKEGAEGLYAMGITPAMAERIAGPLEIPRGAALGMVIKIHDGSMTRGRNPVILSLLQSLGIDIEERPLLESWRDPRILNAAGQMVGEWKTEYELRIL